MSPANARARADRYRRATAWTSSPEGTGEGTSSNVGLPNLRPRTNAKNTAARAIWNSTIRAPAGNDPTNPFGSAPPGGSGGPKTTGPPAPNTPVANAALSALPSSALVRGEIPPRTTTFPLPTGVVTSNVPSLIGKHPTPPAPDASTESPASTARVRTPAISGVKHPGASFAGPKA